MKKTITRFVLFALSLLILTTTAFAASKDTPVKIMLVDKQQTLGYNVAVNSRFSE